MNGIALIDHVGKKAGLDHYDLSLARALIKLQVNVEVFSNFESDETFVHKHFSFSFSRKLIRLPFFLFKYLTAIRTTKSKKVNIVMQHMFHFSIIDLMTLKLVKINNLKSCIIVHDVESLVLSGRNFIEKCIEVTDHVVVHNSFIEEELRKKTNNKSNGKVTVIPHGHYFDVIRKVTREEALKKLNLDPSKKYVLFFGMIKKSKGLDVLIDALENVSEEIHLLIAGRPRDVSEEECRNMTRHLKGRVHLFLEYISNDQRNLIFSATDVLVIPYRKVYQSGVLIMGMSYGIPVIASDIEPNRIIVKESNGILFKSGDSADLANRLNALFADDEKGRAIGKSGHEYLEKFHDWNLIGKKFKNIIS